MGGARPRGVSSLRTAADGLRSREGAAALALAVLAALRVGLFAAAFPFFSNVDEHRHVDAVLKYARGYLPAPGTDAYEPEMATLLGVYGSPEYHGRAAGADATGAESIPPPWKGSPARMVKMIEYNERFLAGRPNLEAFQPPVYYAVAAGWLHLGRALGFEGGRLLYWVRELGAVLMFALVLGAWLFLRGVYRGDAFVRLGVPALLVVFPQDVFYYVTRDVFSPLVGGAALVAAVTVARRSNAGFAAFATAGLIGAAAFLSKYMNGAVLVLYAFATVAVMTRADGERRVAKLALMWALVALPVGLWLMRNELVFGELLATGVKVDRLGWGRKPLSEYWDHPIFSLGGSWIFVREWFPTFWRGELAWHRITLAYPAADAFYTASSLLFLALAAYGMLRRQPGDARFTEATSLLGVSAAAGLLVVLSLAFVFGERTNPTADNPYLSQGRLAACALVPFALLYVRGIDVAASFAPAAARRAVAWTLLAVALGVAAGSEIALSTAVFASEYNWFHFP